MSNIPADLLYTEEHEWVQIEKGIATVGITDHAQDELGDVVYVELPEVGTQVAQNDEAATVESVKAASEIYSPVSGEVIEVNEQLNDAPELLNKEPYSDGWICRIRLSKPEEADSLLQPEDYRNLLEA